MTKNETKYTKSMMIKGKKKNKSLRTEEKSTEKCHRKKKSLKNFGLSWRFAVSEVVKRLLKAVVERGSDCTPPGARSARMFALSSTPPATAAEPAARAAFAERSETCFTFVLLLLLSPDSAALFRPLRCAFRNEYTNRL